jgi:hypothetical protein
MATPLEQLDAMRTLRADWDGYNADPPSPEVIELAKEFVGLLTAFRGADPLREIHVSPGRAGGVLIEWVVARSEHELEIEPDGTWGFLHADRATGKMTERKFIPTRQVVHLGVLKEIRDLVAA